MRWRSAGIARSPGWPLAAALLLGASAFASQDGLQESLTRYRQQVAADNPAELWEIRGEALWKEVRGPGKASLERCDLGLGPGVVAGAYARLPRYFPDTDQVQDLESRLLTCINRLQGIPLADAARQPFGNGERKSDLEALTAYLAGKSRGVALHIPLEHPKEREAYELGKQIFYYRAGTHDFSCATCHSEEGKRIRLQVLPDLTSATGAQAAYTVWPAYRISQGELRTLEWRLNDCFRQQRFPDLRYGSEVAIALTLYLARTADGGVMQAPALKR